MGSSNYSSDEDDHNHNDPIKKKEEEEDDDLKDRKKKKKDKKKKKKKEKSEKKMENHQTFKEEEEEEEDGTEEENAAEDCKKKKKKKKHEKINIDEIHIQKEEEKEDNAAENHNKKKRKRKPRKKKNQESEDAESNNNNNNDAEKEEKQEEKPLFKDDGNENNIFAPRDVTDLPPKKRRKITEEEKIGKRKKDLRRTIYVEGLPYTYDEDLVKKFFHESLDLVQDDIIDVRLPRWQDSGRLRGYGHIVFNTIHIRDKALRNLNGKTIGDRYITIKDAQQPKERPASSSASDRYKKVRAEPRAQPPNCRTIFVKNLPYGATDRDVLDAFSKFGKVVEEGGVRLARNSRTRQSKGFGYVQFKNMEAANAAVENAFKTPVTIGNRSVFVDYDDSGQAKGSYRDEKGWLWKKKFATDKSE